MENLNTNERYKFMCGRWLSKKEEDKQTIRELPAEDPGIKKPLPVVKYFIDVYTGDKRGAGTNSNVFINVFGECGDTGGTLFSQSSFHSCFIQLLIEFLERPLEHSKNKDKFERKQVKACFVEMHTVRV